MTRKRKPLGDALAKDFVYRTNELSPNVETIDRSPVNSQESIDNQQSVVKSEESVDRTKQLITDSLKLTPTKELSLMEKLQIEAKEATTRFTVDLPNTMHRKLSLLAVRTGRKKAEIVRMLLDEALKDVED
jgi:hypothetical protein